ncbi:hypothetical protein ABZ479_04740 [Streptomyces sp. NPDC005722]
MLGRVLSAGVGSRPARRVGSSTYRIRTRLGWDEPGLGAAAHCALPPGRMRRVLADAGL